MQAKLLLDAKSLLGEGSLWDWKSNRLYWVDIEGLTLNVYDPVAIENKVFGVGKRIGTVVPETQQSVLIALEDGIAALDLATGEIEYRVETDIHKQYNRRFNDGKCDPHGRFWVGTLSMDGKREVSSLYCIGPDFNIEEKITGVSISNGITWSLDGDSMYYIDTPTQQIVQYDFDKHAGHISNGRVIIEIPEEMGSPDGMTIDADGMLWIALWDGFAVVQYHPETGRLLQTVSVPAPKVTSCAFGGDNLDELFITTASVEMTDEELEKYPLSGGLFSVKVNARGVPAHVFRTAEGV
jgi:sugar lactone lactonase YvrE